MSLAQYTTSRKVNLYGGKRTSRAKPHLRAGQVRRIVTIIVSIMIAMALAKTSNTMSAADARKYGAYILGIFRKFLSIVKTFSGYERQVEAGASAIAAVISRKVTSGVFRLNSTNLMVAAGAYTLTRHTGTGVSNFINHMNKRSNSFFQVPGTQAALNEKIRTALITMLAWMISSLNFFSATKAMEIVRVELRARGILRANQTQLANAGRRQLKLTS